MDLRSAGGSGSWCLKQRSENGVWLGASVAAVVDGADRAVLNTFSRCVRRISSTTRGTNLEDYHKDISIISEFANRGDTWAFRSWVVSSISVSFFRSDIAILLDFHSPSFYSEILALGVFTSMR